MGRRRPGLRSVLGLVVLALLAGCSPSTATPAAPGSVLPTGSGQTGAQACAWPRKADVLTANKLILDASETAWIEFFPVEPGLRIVVAGTFPDARYASLQVYTPVGAPFTRNGVGSTLTDYQITPDQGSVNPWRQQAAPGGHFTVTLREDVEPGQANAIPLAPEGTTSGLGLLVYRVYLPAGGDVSQVEPPTLTLEQGDLSASLTTCTTFDAPLSVPGSSAVPTPAPTATPSPSATAQPVGELQFFKADIGALGPNTDTPYLLAYLTPPGPGDVVVIRGKAPTHASGDHPSPWPAADVDVRYWSLCSAIANGVLPTVMNLLPSGGVDTGCRADDQVTLDAAGDFAFVLGTESQRATIEGVADATFLPFSAAQPATTHILALRDMLVNPSFAYSPARVSQANDPAATEAVMGSYYPVATVCPLSTLVADGVSGCSR
jgi:hypothetical protein